MPYLIPNDYLPQIQIANLEQIINKDYTILTAAAAKAQEQCESMLTQKYLVEAEFTDTNPWVATASYGAASRVYTADVNGFFMGMYYAAYPAPQFNSNTYYPQGAQVFYNGSVYTALQGSGAPADALQYATYANIPGINTMPGVNNQWDAGAPYAIPAGTPLTDNRWVAGDNRGQRLLEVLIDITLYKIHSRIAPRNIPELRVKNYDDALKWLQDAATGEHITPRLPLRQPGRGGRVRFGGNVKCHNSW
jgi:hypothetical protein